MATERIGQPKGPRAGPQSLARIMDTDFVAVMYAWLYVSIVLLAVTMALVALRVYAARVVVRKWHRDDTIIIVASVFAVAFASMQIIVCKFALDIVLGRGNPFSLWQPLVKLQGLGVTPAYSIATILVKSAVLAYLTRLTVSSQIKLVAKITLALTVLQGIAVSCSLMVCAASLNTIADIFVIQPGRGGRVVCSQVGMAWVVTAFVNSLTDLTLLVLPLWILKPLRAPWEKKLAITAVLMAGGFVFGVSIYRAYQAFALLESMAIYVEWIMAALWCVVELCAGIVCACLPAAKVVFSHLTRPKAVAESIHGPSKNRRIFRTMQLRTLTQPTAVRINSWTGSDGTTRVGCGCGNKPCVCTGSTSLSGTTTVARIAPAVTYGRADTLSDAEAGLAGQTQTRSEPRRLSPVPGEP